MVPCGSLADEIAEGLRLLVGPNLPINLYRLAENLGVQRVTDVNELVEDGRVFWRRGSPCIELRSDRSASRMRFTLAHEIAHIALAATTGERETRRRRDWMERPGDEEKLCDMIAGALLMPRWLVEHHAQEDFDLAALYELRNEARVSLAAAAVRYVEITHRVGMLLTLRRIDERWLPLSAVARPRGLGGRVRLATKTCREIAESRSARFSCNVHFSVDEKKLSGRADVHREGYEMRIYIKSLRSCT